MLLKVEHEPPRCENAEAHDDAVVMAKQVTAAQFALYGVGVYGKGTA